MDPNEALELVRKFNQNTSAAIGRVTDTDTPLAGAVDDLVSEATALVEHVQDLDEWLTRGGFAPTAWTAASTNARRTTLWQVNAHVSYMLDGWARSLALPTFQLNASIQGITGEAHAKSIVATMLGDLIGVGTGTSGIDAALRNIEYHVTVVPIEVIV